MQCLANQPEASFHALLVRPCASEGLLSGRRSRQGIAAAPGRGALPGGGLQPAVRARLAQPHDRQVGELGRTLPSHSPSTSPGGSWSSLQAASMEHSADPWTSTSRQCSAAIAELQNEPQAADRLSEDRSAICFERASLCNAGCEALCGVPAARGPVDADVVAESASAHARAIWDLQRLRSACRATGRHALRHRTAAPWRRRPLPQDRRAQTATLSAIRTGFSPTRC
jgi:hypothetical protein